MTGYTSGIPPSGAARLVPDAANAALTRPLPDRSASRLTFVTDDGERADAFRAVKTDLEWSPSVFVDPERTAIVEEPTADELEGVLRERTDILICELPTSGANLECLDGSLRLDAVSEIGASSVVLCESDGIDAGLAAVDSGVRSGLVTERRLSSSHLRRLSLALLTGWSMCGAAQLAGFDGTVPHRFVGEPLAPIVRHTGGVAPTLLDIESTSADEHELSVLLPLTAVNPLGSIGNVLDGNVSDAYQLFGSLVEQPFRCATSDVVRYLEDDDYVVRLNGEIHFAENAVTGKLVSESARRHLETDQ